MNYKYIDPGLKDIFKKAPEAIRKEIDFASDIATRIDEVLQRKGWSKSDLARATGKKEPEVSRWMSGVHNYTIRTLAIIEAALGEKIITVNKFRPKRK